MYILFALKYDGGKLHDTWRSGVRREWLPCGSLRSFIVIIGIVEPRAPEISEAIVDF